MKKEFYSNGKLLLTAEYAVLDGAKCLALPTKLGQKMTVKSSRGSDLIWESLDKDGNSWFNSHISLYDFSGVNTTDQSISDNIQKILKNAVRLNSEFLSKWSGFKVETQLQFPLDWGLGSSSSLIALVAQWAGVNPLMLYYKCENGSGYDVAAGVAEGPIVFYSNEEETSYNHVDFDPAFKDDLYFVHLGVKKDSKQGIREYIKAVKNRDKLVSACNDLTEKVQEVSKLADFEKLLMEHEAIIAKHTGFAPVKEQRFADYDGAIKSLGAWGGDFVLATSDKGPEHVTKYFKEQGLNTVLKYADLIL